jgi:predicted O-methyltransferase YrrM
VQQHPALQGALFDLPPTADIARQFLAGQGLSHRCDVVAGDFLQAVPRGYDAYLLKSVLHDWDDEHAVQILRQCRAAMPRHGRVVVVEIVVTPGQPLGHPHPMIDLEMLVTYGGQERTAPEFATLFTRAGLALAQVLPITDSFFSVVEATPS